jgi:hypothetical protein
MNLYKFHSDPKSLNHYAEAQQSMPEVFVHDDTYQKDFIVRDFTQKQIRAISKDPKWACLYAITALNRKRWPEAEPYIMKDPGYAYTYARSVIKKRWPEAEKYIRGDEHWWSMYIEFFEDEFGL